MSRLTAHQIETLLDYVFRVKLKIADYDLEGAKAILKELKDTINQYVEMGWMNPIFAKNVLRYVRGTTILLTKKKPKAAMARISQLYRQLKLVWFTVPLPR